MTQRNLPKKTAKKQQAAKKNQQNNTAVSKVTHHQFSGPIPPPSILSDYNEVVSGAAERILLMAEANSAHQINIETIALTEAVGATKRGQICGLIIGLSTFVTVMFAVWHGCQVTASIVGGTTVVGLVAVFVTGRVWSPKENDKENNEEAH